MNKIFFYLGAWFRIVRYLIILRRSFIYFVDFKTRPEEAEAVPYVYVSEQKWGFLQNGALQCLQEVHAKTFGYSPGTGYKISPWVLINCLNSPVGRYVAFVFPKRTNIFENMNKFFVEERNIKQFISLKGK